MADLTALTAAVQANAQAVLDLTEAIKAAPGGAVTETDQAAIDALAEQVGVVTAAARAATASLLPPTTGPSTTVSAASAPAPAHLPPTNAPPVVTGPVVTAPAGPASAVQAAGGGAGGGVVLDLDTGDVKPS